jgi:predicted ferric reductase
MTSALWYFGRGAGVSALVLFTLVVVLGVVVRVGRPLPGLPRFTVAAIHRTTSLTALGFLAVHIGTLVLDPYAQLRVFDTVVPFFAAYRPFWQGLGTLAFDLVLLLIASSLLRARIGLRAWRWLHGAAYLCWPIAVAHAVGNGTDGTTTWMLWIAGGCVGAVVLAVGWRLEVAPEPPVVRAVPPPAGLGGLR